MRTANRPAFEIEEPIARSEIPKYPSNTYWTQFLQDILARLGELNGTALPVKFGSPAQAVYCRQAFGCRRAPGPQSRYAAIDSRLRATQRREHVFFWLEKDGDTPPE